MEKERSSFYDFILNSSKVTKEDQPEKSKHKPSHLFIAWLLLFLFNVLIFHTGWNFAIATIFDLPSISFMQSFVFYSSIKVLTNGVFSL